MPVKLPPGYRLVGPPQDDGEQTQPAPSQQDGFLTSAWDELSNGPLNLKKTGDAINEAVTHPVKSVSGWGQQIYDMGRKAGASFQKGDVVKGIRQSINTGLNAVVPGMGTSAEQAGEEFDKGNVGGGLGKTVGIGVNTAASLLTPKAMQGVAQALPKPLNPSGSSLSGLTRANPKVAITRALRPASSDPYFSERLPDTLGNVKKANSGVSPASNAEMMPAVQHAIDNHNLVLEQWMDRASGHMASGEPIIEATRESVSKMLPSERAAGDALVQRAIVDYGKPFTAGQLKDRLQLLNKRLDPFYSKSPSKQSAALADIPDAVLQAQRDATAEALYNLLDPENGGAGPRLIQRQIGDMIDLKNAGLRRSNAIIGESPVSPLGKVADQLKSIPRALLPKTNVSIPDGTAGGSDRLIRRSFDAAPNTNVPPLPETAAYPQVSGEASIGAVQKGRRATVPSMPAKQTGSRVINLPNAIRAAALYGSEAPEQESNALIGTTKYLNGKPVRITKVYADGSVDYEPVSR